MNIMYVLMIAIQKKLKIDKRRRYFARVTEAYRKFGLIDDDGSFKPTNAIWIFSDGKIRIKLMR